MVAGADEAAGFRLTDAKEFAGLSDEEDCMIRTRLALVRLVRERRSELGWTQAELAKAMGSTQARVAKIGSQRGTGEHGSPARPSPLDSEGASPDVSVELLLRGAFALGLTPRDVGRALQVA